MSKSILVIDTPECCMECPMCFQSDEISIGKFEYRKLYSCRCTPSDVEDFYLPDILHSKPDWCPFRYFPGKMTMDNQSFFDESYIAGRNNCIDEILKGDDAE